MASPRKPCKKCKKQIPAIALDCVFCGAKQEAPPLEELLPAALTRAKEAAARVEAQQAAGGNDMDFADSFATEPTLVGLKVSDLAALGIGAPQPSGGGGDHHSSDLGGGAQPASSRSVYGDPVEAPLTKPDSKPDSKKPETKPAPPSTKSTQITATIAPAADKRPAPITPGAAEATMRLAQTVAIGAGVVLLVLFFLPWGGATSWQLLENIGGRAFFRQFWYLVGGATLVATGALPLPQAFRTVAIAMLVAPFLIFGPIADGTGSLLGSVGFIILAIGGANEKYRRGASIAVAVVFAALLFLARGMEYLHAVGWVAAAAGLMAAQMISPWPSARRSTAS